MPTVTYSIYFSSGTNAVLKGNATLSTTMTRDSVVPANSKPVSATITFNSIVIYSSRSPYMKFGDWFTTTSFPKTGDSGSDATLYTFDVSSFASNILETESASFTTTVVGSSTLNMLQLRSSYATQTVEYEESYSTSTATFSPQTVYAGDSVTVSIKNSKLSVLNHKITLSIGEYSLSEYTNDGVGSVSIEVPEMWLYAIPSSPSGKIAVSVTTYDGVTLVGTKSYSLTLACPEDIIPTAGSLIASRIDNNVPSSWDMYIQNRSGVQLTVYNADGILGSTISSYSFSGGITTITETNELTISPIQKSGDVTFSVKVTDSRGRESEPVSVTIHVEPYSPPTFVSAVAYRCADNGEPNEEGTYIEVETNLEYTGFDGLNSATLSCYYQRIGESEWTLGAENMEAGTTYLFGDGLIDTGYTYQVKLIAQDSFSTVERIIDVNTTLYTMFFRRGGTGVGIGKACEHDFALELNPAWRFYYGTDDLIQMIYKLANTSIPSIVYSETEPEGTEGMIWLKPI